MLAGRGLDMILIKLFFTFCKIAAFTFGGGYAMLPFIQTEVVDKNEWVSNNDFLDSIAIAQSSPGPVAVNTAILLGYKINGVLGALACAFGVIFPSFVIILTIAKFLYQYKDYEIVGKVFLGIRPAVVALIATAVYKLGKSIKSNKKVFIISGITVVIVGFLDVSPIIMILFGGLGSVIFFRLKERKEQGKANEEGHL